MAPVKKTRSVYKTADGTRVSSVTTIIGETLGWGKQGLIIWANREGLEGRDHKENRDKAADTGTLAHDMIESYLNGVPLRMYRVPEGTPIEMRMAAEQAFNAFRSWRGANSVMIRRSEVALVSEEYQYGGRYDADGYYNDRFVIFDWKTSKAVYESYIIQVAAYMHLYEEQWDSTFPLEAAVIVRIGKDGEFAVKEIERADLDLGWNVFKNLIEIHRTKKRFESLAKGEPVFKVPAMELSPEEI